VQAEYGFWSIRRRVLKTPPPSSPGPLEGGTSASTSATRPIEPGQQDDLRTDLHVTRPSLTPWSKTIEASGDPRRLLGRRCRSTNGIPRADWAQDIVRVVAQRLSPTVEASQIMTLAAAP